jgi:hypothetical protein
MFHSLIARQLLLPGFALFQLPLGLFPHGLHDIAAPAEIPGDLREIVDVDSREIPEPYSARRARIQRCGGEDVCRRTRLATSIEFVDEPIPDFLSIRRALQPRGSRARSSRSVVAHTGFALRPNNDTATGVRT